MLLCKALLVLGFNPIFNSLLFCSLKMLLKIQAVLVTLTNLFFF